MTAVASEDLPETITSDGPTWTPSKARRVAVIIGIIAAVASITTILATLPTEMGTVDGSGNVKPIVFDAITLIALAVAGVSVPSVLALCTFGIPKPEVVYSTESAAPAVEAPPQEVRARAELEAPPRYEVVYSFPSAMKAKVALVEHRGSQSKELKSDTFTSGDYTRAGDLKGEYASLADDYQAKADELRGMVAHLVTSKS